MKKILLPFLCLLPILCLLPCLAAAQSSVRQQKDSLRHAITLTEGEEKLLTYFRLTNLYYAEAYDVLKRDTLLALYDEWDAEEVRQNARHRTSIRTNILFMFQKAGMYDEVIRRAPEYLQFMAEQEAWVAYYQAYQVLIKAYDKIGDNENALATAQKMYGHARESGSKGGMGSAFYAMSEIYNSQGRFGEMEKSLTECIALLREQTRYYGVLVNAYNNLGMLYIQQQRIDEALETARNLENFLPRYEETLRAAQPNAWHSLWLLYTNVWRYSGDYGKAERYIQKMDSITGGENADRYYETRAQVYLGQKRYAKALEAANRGIEELSPQERGALRKIKIEILARSGDVDGAIAQLNEFDAEQSTLHDAELNAALDEIRTRYEVDKLEYEKNKAVIDRQRTRNYLLFTLGVCVLLALVLSIWVYYSRKIVRKNRGLYRQIKEQERLSDELDRMTLRFSQLEQSLSPARTDGDEIPPSETETEAETPPDGKEMYRRQLVINLHKYILDRQDLRRTDMDRDDFVTALNTNRTTLSKAVKTVTGQSMMEYINMLYIEKAKKMLDTRPELSLMEISESCGIPYSTFHRLFKDRYHITPSEYRKIAYSRL
jgi:AraC-like DNA-binding protein